MLKPSFPSCVGLSLVFITSLVSAANPIHIGDRRELFVDKLLIDKLDNARLALHAPQPQETVLKFDKPWEGIYSGYETVLHDAGKLRIYYRGLPIASAALGAEVTCVAESRDGVHWTRPELGLFEVHGTKANNVVLANHGACHNFAPFIDQNPDCPPAAKYKALGRGRSLDPQLESPFEHGLYAFQSPDGIHWQQIGTGPVMTEGAFDSQNNAFWSESERLYVCYFRVFRDRIRWIARSTSDDFVHWSKPVDLELDDKPRQHLYTNQLTPYTRAPHIYLGLPTRFFPGRRAVTPEEAAQIGTSKKTWNFASDCTDILLTSARGGSNFKRTFLEAFIRPGPDLRNWTSRANYAARGIVQISPDELTFFVKHNSGYSTAHMRRYAIRPDGFVSVYGPYDGGTLITKPLTFAGKHLNINFATSAGGSVRVEVQSPAGQAIPGFALADCVEMIGDRFKGRVRWKDNSKLGQLAGQPIRLRFVLHDADIYSLRFVE
ncbi:MAG: hypothetical protein MK165_16455 [Pirellulaceae bacterium]|nr:hypothetical protein [Pirellulaceae bacterium]